MAGKMLDKFLDNPFKAIEQFAAILMMIYGLLLLAVYGFDAIAYSTLWLIFAKWMVGRD